MALRIKGLEINEVPIFARPIYWACKKLYGKVITPIKVRSRRPKILYAEGILDKAIHSKSKVGHRILTLAELRVAQIIECPF
jgi:hypothetical protein